MLPLLAALTAAPAWSQDAQPPSAPEDEDYSEIVLVWPDRFARWKDTRWLVATEVVIPTGFVFARTNNQGFRSFAWQVKAVIACDKDFDLLGKRIEVLCDIEDIALQATSYARFKRERDKRLVQEVLDELDAKLTNAKIQLQVNERGSVTDVGIEGLPRRNRRDGWINESLRQVVMRMMYPFHMRLPKSGVREGNWPEFDSELMTMPSIDGVRGSSVIVHWMNFYKGYLLVQDVGEGVVEVTPLPASLEGLDEGGDVDSSAASSEAAPTLASGLGIEGGGFSAGGLYWRLNLNGVSIYNIDNGIMEERVWNMVGTPTASNTSLLKYWYSGRIQLLGDDDVADVGPTRQIGYPGISVEGLPEWIPVDPEIAKDMQDHKPRATLDMTNRVLPQKGIRRNKEADEDAE